MYDLMATFTEVSENDSLETDTLSKAIWSILCNAMSGKRCDIGREASIIH